MKRLLLLASAFALLTGCASDRNATYRGTTGSMGSGTDAGYGIGVAPNQQGAGAVQLTTSQLSPDTLDFMRHAAQFNQTDIQMGQAMVQKSDTPELKTYGQLLVDNHTLANQQLMAIVAQTGATVSTTPNQEQQDMLNRLDGLNGTEFDRTAINDSIRVHEHEVHLYSQAANNVQTPSVKTYAQDNLTAVQNELNQARTLSAPAPTSAPVTTVPPGNTGTVPPQQPQ